MNNEKNFIVKNVIFIQMINLTFKHINKQRNIRQNSSHVCIVTKNINLKVVCQNI